MYVFIGAGEKEIANVYVAYKPAFLLTTDDDRDTGRWRVGFSDVWAKRA